LLLPNASRSKKTYARELDAAVTALGGSTALLDVKNPSLAAGGLDDPRPVGGGVVATKTVNFSLLRLCLSNGDWIGLVKTHGFRRR
jgi:hypothetical protein